ncbi:MAG: GAF domain-containing protein [Anaerolineae bacterium]|nr:GAF domain-containing protein [Anaerolineae bacterium]
MYPISFTHFSIVLPLVFIGLSTAAVAAFIWSRRHTARWTIEITLLLTALFIWTFGYAAELTLPALPLKLLMAKVQYVGITAVPYFWLTFALQFAGYQRLVTRQRLYWLAVIPVATLLLAFTNEWHELIWSSVALDSSNVIAILQLGHGIWFWVFNVFAQLCMVVGSIVLILYLNNIHRHHHWRVRLLAFLPLIPLLGNLAYLLDWVPIPGLDLTPYAFSVSGFFLAWGIYRLELFDINPVARQTAVSSIKDGLIVLDNQQRIIDINPAASRILDREADAVIGKHIIAVIRKEPDLVACYQRVINATSAAVFDLTFNGRSYDVDLSKVKDDFGVTRAWIVSFRDISERKETENELAQQKSLFEGIAKIAKALAEGHNPRVRFQNALNTTAALAHAENGSLFILNEHKELTNAYFTSELLPSSELKRFLQQISTKGMLGWMVENQKLVIIPDTREDPRWVSTPDWMMNPLSVLAIPIVHKQHLIGILTLEHSQANFFQPEVADMLSGATSQIALGLENVRMYELEMQHAAQQKTLYQVLRQINLHLDSHTFIQNTVNVIQRHIAWKAVHIFVPAEGQTTFNIEASTFKNGKLLATLAQAKQIQEIVGQAFHTGETQNIANMRLTKGETVLPLNSMIAVPMLYKKEKLGILVAQDGKTAVFNTEETWLAESLAEAIALAWSNARLHNQTKLQLREQTAIRQAVAAITSTLDLSSLLNQLAQQMGEAINATSVLIHRYEPDTKRSEVLARFHAADATKEERTQCEKWRQQINTKHLTDKLKGTLIFKAATSGKNGAAQNEINPMLTLPLHVGHKTIAFAELWNSRDTHEFSQKEISLARTIAQHAAIAIENANLFQAINEEQGRLTALIQSSRDGIILVGTNRRILIVNDMALKMLEQEFESAPEWIGRTLSEILSHLMESFPQAVRSMQIMPAGHDLKTGEFKLGEKIIHWQNLLVNADNQAIGHLLLLRDITDERLLERMRDDLTHTMVHDLRNPMGAIKISLDLLAVTAQKELSEKSKSLVQRAASVTERTLDLVNQILDISQLESGKMPITQEAFDLRELIDEVLETQSAIATEKRIALETRLPRQLPQVWADRRLMARVLQNLVGNALKFTPVGGQVTVGVSNGRSAANEPLQLTITDTGSGIPDTIRPHLFQKFATGDQKERGNGLGLAFCKMVQDNHGEKIEILDSSPQGTTFGLTLAVFKPNGLLQRAQLTAAKVP